jgi:hypothetical protein
MVAEDEIWKCYFSLSSPNNDDGVAAGINLASNMQHIYFRISGVDLFAFQYANKPNKVKFMHTLPGC